MTSPLPRWLLTLVVGLCAIALPASAVPTVTAAIVHCCCGDHDASHGCACPDCPANHHGDPAPRDTTIKACGGASIEVTVASHPAIVPVVTVPLRDVATAAVAPIVAPPRLLLPEPPPSPPPRG